MPVHPDLPEPIQSRLDRIERTIKRLQIITVLLIVFVVLFISDLFFPGVLGILTFGLVIAAILGSVLLFISAIMGLLELWSPSGRLDESRTSRTDDARTDKFSDDVP